MASSVCCLGWSTATLDVINLLMTESIRWFGYLSLRKTSLRYPNHLIDSVINRFITSRVAVDQPKQHTDDAIRIVIPYKYQDAAVSVKRQLRDLSSKVQKTIQPVFTSRKLKQAQASHHNPAMYCLFIQVWPVQCRLSRVHKGPPSHACWGTPSKGASIYRHYCKEHNTSVPNNFLARFNVIKKCTNKFDCLVNEMLCIQYLKPALNVQSDSLRAKVFM